MPSEPGGPHQDGATGLPSVVGQCHRHHDGTVATRQPHRALEDRARRHRVHPEQKKLRRCALCRSSCKKRSLTCNRSPTTRAPQRSPGAVQDAPSRTCTKEDCSWLGRRARNTNTARTGLAKRFTSSRSARTLPAPTTSSPTRAARQRRSAPTDDQRRVPDPLDVPRHRRPGRQVPQQRQLGDTLDHFGHIDEPGSGPYSSLPTGKYSADDNWRLVEFDPTLRPRELEAHHDAREHHRVRRRFAGERAIENSVAAVTLLKRSRSRRLARDRELDARADRELVDRAVDQVAHEEHAFVEPHDHRAVGRAIGEGGQGRRMHDRERPHLARHRDRLPTSRSVEPQCAHTGRGWMPERAARRTVEPSSALSQAPTRNGVVGVGGLGPRDHRSTPNSTAPAGSLIAPHTNAISAPAT